MRYWKCTVCGYIHEGSDPPEKCPVCGAPASKFQEIPGPDGKAAYDAYMAKMGNTLKGVLEKAEQKKKEEAERAAAAREVEAEVKATVAQKMPAPPLADPASAPAPAPSPAPAPRPNLIFRLMAENHSHPVAVHTPNGILPMAVFFLFLSTGLAFTNLIAPPPCLDSVALYSLIFVALAMPAVLFTGWVEWRVKYGAPRTRVFVTKIICGIAVTILAASLAGWNLLTAGAAAGVVAGAGSGPHWLYLLLHLLMLAAAAYAGHLGGMLVFKK